MSVIFDTLRVLYSGTCALRTPKCNNIRSRICIHFTGYSYWSFSACPVSCNQLTPGRRKTLLTYIQLTALLEDIDGLLKIEMFAA